MKNVDGSPATWTEAAPAPLARGEVDIWRINLDVDCDLSILDQSERDRASRFAFVRDARRFSHARSHLRRLLGAYLGESPQALRFDAGAFGKPHLAKGDRRIAFNVSHSERLALIGIGKVSALGVDVEAVRPFPNRDEIAEQNFAPAEISSLLALQPEQRQDAFFGCWTQKEAIIKLWGEGLSADLTSFVVNVDPNRPARVVSVTRPGVLAREIIVRRFQPAADFWGAAAVPAADRPRLRFCNLA